MSRLFRGASSDVAGCLVVIVVANVLAGLWETGPDPTRKGGACGNDPGR
jgi:hypothetical protein